MRVRLGKVAKESRETLRGSKRGLPIVGLEHITPSELMLTEWDVDSENTFTKAFRKGQMLFGRRRAYLKKATVAPFDGICSGDITVIEAVPEKLLPELLPFIIQNDTFFDYAVGKSAGSLSPRVKWEHLQNFEFTLPPVVEQRKLADLLWAVNAARAAYKELLAATDELIKSQFIEMFGDILERTKEWPYSPLGEHSDILGGNPFDSSGYVNSGIKICGGLIVMPDRIAWEEAKHWGTTEGLEKYLLQEEDVVLAMDRPWITSGFKVAMIKRSELPALLIQRTARIRGTDLNQHYILWALRSDAFLKHCNITQTTVPHISMGDIKNYVIPIPPLELQNQFADFVQQTDKSKFELQRTIDELEATYKSLLRENLG